MIGSEKILPYNNEEQKGAQVQRMFDQIAHTYDPLNHLLSFGFDKYWRRQGIQYLRQFQPKQILDIATGTGDLAIAIQQKLHAERIIGADLSEGMMKVGEKKVKAAGLEEHYPHSMAKAVVAEAARRGLRHEERHSRVEYLVAHGISSSVDGQKVVIGSHHFVFEDEHCVIPAGEQAKFDALPDTYSHLYLAVSGVLAAVICIEDPLRPEAADVIRGLRELGVSKLVMMTGDNEKTARAVAEAVGVDAYFAEVLPEDKAAFIQAEHAAGRKVIMLGDGVNDSPALSEADAGVAISDGAAIAREVADITVSSEDMYALLTLKRLSDALMERIHSNYRKIISFNFLLICLGVAGVLPPATSALLHNASTLVISLKSMTKLLA